MSKVEYTHFDKGSLDNILKNLVKDYFARLADECADNLLLTELRYLYINQIYENSREVQVVTEDLATHIDAIISKYCELMLYDFGLIIDQIDFDLQNQRQVALSSN